MNGQNLKAKILISSFFLFGALSGMGGAVVYLHQDFLNTWIGSALIGGPILAWIIFALMADDWIKRPRPIKKEKPEKAVGEGEEKTEAEKRKPVPAEDIPSPEAVQEEAARMREALPQDGQVVIVQLLGLLQREGRLLDFLQEDIEPYDDAQIGAAAREVHRGCRAAVREILGIRPILDAAEGSDVEIETDFDSTRIKLTGNVHGQPPYKGILRHCGWKMTENRLPKWTAKNQTDVLAPAEVEIP